MPCLGDADIAFASKEFAMKIDFSNYEEEQMYAKANVTTYDEEGDGSFIARLFLCLPFVFCSTLETHLSF